jgi:hypothetical protein
MLAQEHIEVHIAEHSSRYLVLPGKRSLEFTQTRLQRLVVRIRKSLVSFLAVWGQDSNSQTRHERGKVRRLDKEDQFARTN